MQWPLLPTVVQNSFKFCPLVSPVWQLAVRMGTKEMPWHNSSATHQIRCLPHAHHFIEEALKIRLHTLPRVYTAPKREMPFFQTETVLLRSSGTGIFWLFIPMSVTISKCSNQNLSPQINDSTWNQGFPQLNNSLDEIFPPVHFTNLLFWILVSTYLQEAVN